MTLYTCGNGGHVDTLNRHWLMLRMIPRRGKITTMAIKDRLEREHNVSTTIRTIQRDLISLSRPFPLVADNHKPCGWSWEKGAVQFDIPGMDLPTALTFKLIEAYLAPLIPRPVLQSLTPHMESATNLLAQRGESKLGLWPEKVCVIPAGQPLLAPEIDPDVLGVAYEALLGDCRFTANYRRRGEDNIVEYEISPLGLVFRDKVIYLVATLRDYEDVMLLVLHRMSSPRLLEKPATKLAGFTLQEYVASGELQFQEQPGTIKLVALFEPYAAAHLVETPLSRDQRVKETADGWIRVESTVQDTQQLRWWLLSFGDNVEVVKPKRLRTEFEGISRNLAMKYAVANTEV